MIKTTEPVKVKPPLQPSFPLDVVAGNFLLTGPGTQLTALQREMFLELARETHRVERYAKIGATNAEIALMFFLPVAAIDLFEPVLASSRAFLNDRIREAWLKAADSGNEVALTYLSKVYLEADTKAIREAPLLPPRDAPLGERIGRSHTQLLRRVWQFLTERRRP